MALIEVIVLCVCRVYTYSQAHELYTYIFLRVNYISKVIEIIRIMMTMD